MRVTLDKDVWEIEDHVRLEDVLADLSDRAQARGRLVTKLTVGNRPMTDRELVPNTLSQPARDFAPIFAESESVETIVQKSEKTAQKFAQQINKAAQELVKNFRMGVPSLQPMDRWLGQMADYLEWGHISQSLGKQRGKASFLQGWVEELLEARHSSDQVRIADILEYEIIPLLTRASGECH